MGVLLKNLTDALEVVHSVKSSKFMRNNSKEDKIK